MSEDTEIQLNTQIRLSRVPGPKYPHEEIDIFQIKVVPPVPIDKIPDNSVIIRNLYLSIDAAMRVWISGATTYMPPVRPGDVMKAMGVGQVLYSKSKKFQKGDFVLGLLDWQKYAVLPEKELKLLPKGHPNPQLFLGVFGIYGLTAYFGLHQIGRIQKDEIVVISAAAGGVGEIAIQLAKYHGCVVCGIAGSESKCNYIKKIGADYTVNYKKQKVKEALKKYFPKGIDVYFDNVGGEMLDDCLMNIRDQSRIVLCGLVSNYNTREPYKLKNYSRLIMKRGTMRGYLYFDYVKQFPKAIMQMSQMMNEGKLKARIDWSYGLDECPRALRKLLLGQNNGKVIVQVQKKYSPKPKL